MFKNEYVGLVGKNSSIEGGPLEKINCNCSSLIGGTTSSMPWHFKNPVVLGCDLSSGQSAKC